MQQHVSPQPELCDVCVLRCHRLQLAFVEQSLQLGVSDALQSAVLLPIPQFLVERPQIPSSGSLDGPSSPQVRDFSSHALFDVSNLWEFLGLFKARGEASIIKLQLDVLFRHDPVDCFIRKQHGAVVDDLPSV